MKEKTIITLSYLIFMLLISNFVAGTILIFKAVYEINVALFWGMLSVTVCGPIVANVFGD